MQEDPRRISKNDIRATLGCLIGLPVEAALLYGAARIMQWDMYLGVLALLVWLLIAGWFYSVVCIVLGVDMDGDGP